MRTKRFWHIAIPVCIALWTALIWGQSFVPAEKSTADSQVVEHLLPSDAQEIRVEPQWWTEPISKGAKYPIPMVVFVRKAAHFAEFAVLGMLWAVCRRLYPVRLTAAYGLVVGIVDEGIQHFTPGRGSVLSDVAIDTAGYLCGWALMALVLYLWYKKKK